MDFEGEASGGRSAVEAGRSETLCNFTTHNENGDVELLLAEVLAERLARPVRVLMVTGCGSNALALSVSPSVQSVDAADISLPQTMFAELTRAAARLLTTPEDLSAFLGNSQAPRGWRTEKYQAIRGDLPDEAKKFFDSRVNAIEAGAIARGGAEQVRAVLRSQLPSSDRGELAAHPDLVAKALKTAYSVGNLQKYVGGMSAEVAEALARDAVVNLTRQLNAAIAKAAKTGSEDHILHLTLTGSYPMEPEAHRPSFLRSDVFQSIKNKSSAEKLRFHTGPLEQVGQELVRDNGRFDIVGMSNILDMTTPGEAQSLVSSVRECIEPGGILLARWVSQPEALRAILENCDLQIDDDLTSRLHTAETSLFMSGVCAGIVCERVAATN